MAAIVAFTLKATDICATDPPRRESQRSATSKIILQRCLNGFTGQIEGLAGKSLEWYRASRAPWFETRLQSCDGKEEEDPSRSIEEHPWFP